MLSYNYFSSDFSNSISKRVNDWKCVGNYQATDKSANSPSEIEQWCNLMTMINDSSINNLTPR